MFRSSKKRGPGIPARLAHALSLRDMIGTGWRWLTRLGIAVAVILAVLGSLRIKDRVREDARFCLENWSMEVGQLPAWVTPEIVQELQNVDLVAAGDRLSLFDYGSLGEVKAAMERSPWVREVTGIQMKYPTFQVPGVLELELRLRNPVALVDHGGVYYLADGDATRLGAGYREAPTAWFQVPAIVDVPAPGALPEAGARWSARDVLQGVEVAKVLQDSGILRDFPKRPVDAIDLSNLHGRKDPRKSEIILWVGSQRLAWGRSPISAGARAVPVATIISNLRSVLSRPLPGDGRSVIHLDRPPDSLTARS